MELAHEGIKEVFIAKWLRRMVGVHEHSHSVTIVFNDVVHLANRPVSLRRQEHIKVGHSILHQWIHRFTPLKKPWEPLVLVGLQKIRVYVCRVQRSTYIKVVFTGELHHGAEVEW